VARQPDRPGRSQRKRAAKLPTLPAGVGVCRTAGRERLVVHDRDGLEGEVGLAACGVVGGQANNLKLVGGAWRQPGGGVRQCVGGGVDGRQEREVAGQVAAADKEPTAVDVEEGRGFRAPLPLDLNRVLGGDGAADVKLRRCVCRTLVSPAHNAAVSYARSLSCNCSCVRARIVVRRMGVSTRSW